MSRRIGTLALAWRQLRRDLAAGDIRILAAALVLAVVAVTAVGFVTDRAERALAIEANKLLGGDAVLRADAPIAGAARAAANVPGLRSAETVELDSMVRVAGSGSPRASDGASLRLGELQALGAGYPLRGSFTVEVDGGTRAADAIPQPGTVWMSRTGADTLGAKPGDTVLLGDASLRLVALVTQEPGAGFDYFNVAPKVFLNLADLASTGLVQEGSRVRYRLVVAGQAAAVERFVATARANLGRGQRLETIGESRPELRSALDRAGRFLGLAALVSVILAAVAVAMAARRHSERHLSGVAVMRCLGAVQSTLVALHVGELLLLGLIACTIGVAIAFGLQWAVGAWLAQELQLSIPPASIWPALQGYGVGLVVLLAFGAPPVLALRHADQQELLGLRGLHRLHHQRRHHRLRVEPGRDPRDDGTGQLADAPAGLAQYPRAPFVECSQLFGHLLLRPGEAFGESGGVAAFARLRDLGPGFGVERICTREQRVQLAEPFPFARADDLAGGGAFELTTFEHRDSAHVTGGSGCRRDSGCAGLGHAAACVGRFHALASRLRWWSCSICTCAGGRTTASRSSRGCSRAAHSPRARSLSCAQAHSSLRPCRSNSAYNSA